MISCNIPTLHNLYTSRTLRQAGKIATSPSHPGRKLSESVPCGRSLRSIRNKTSCHKNTTAHTHTVPDFSLWLLYFFFPPYKIKKKKYSWNYFQTAGLNCMLTSIQFPQGIWAGSLSVSRIRAKLKQFLVSLLLTCGTRFLTMTKLWAHLKGSVYWSSSVPHIHTNSLILCIYFFLNVFYHWCWDLMHDFKYQIFCIQISFQFCFWMLLNINIILLCFPCIPKPYVWMVPYTQTSTPMFIVMHQNTKENFWSLVQLPTKDPISSAWCHSSSLSTCFPVSLQCPIKHIFKKKQLGNTQPKFWHWWFG